MYKLILILFILILLLSLVHATSLYSQSSKMSLPTLQQRIQHEFNSMSGSFALAFINPDTPAQQLFINEKEVFHAARTMKTPVMIEVYKQASQGKFLLLDSMLVKNEFKSIVDGSMYSINIKDDSGEGLY